MTKAQLDLAHKTIGDLGHCVRAMEQYGNERIAGCMRNAASLLQQMIDEYEAAEPAKMGSIDRSPSAVWRNAVEEDSRG